MKFLKLLNPVNIIATLTLLFGSTLFVFAANIQFIEGGPHRYMSASDSHVRNAHGVGQRRISGGASLAGNGRVHIKVVLTGV